MAQAAAPPTLPRAERYELDRGRYRRVVFFFGRAFLNTLWWELALRTVFGEKFVARGRSERMRRVARRFRQLAVRMGGVMIKLGQFLSTRVDVLPIEITQELQGLQDEVPPVPLFQHARRIRSALLTGRPSSLNPTHPAARRSASSARASPASPLLTAPIG